MANRTDPRVDAHRRSILALHSLLTELTTSPPKTVESEQLIAALVSQGALAAFEDQARGISKMSLNTGKRIADTVIPGGFAELDRLRRVCAALLRQAARTTERPRYGTKDELRQQKLDLEQDMEVLQQDLLVCTKVLELSFQQARRYAAAAGDTTEAVCRKEQRELFAYLSSCSGRPLARGQSE